MADAPQVLSPDWTAYELIDCGGRRKLERFGERLLIRGEPKAWWQANPRVSAWRRVQAEIADAGGNWKFRGGPDRAGGMHYGDLVFETRLTDMSKHVGVFPEQEPHWRWLREKLQAARSRRVLNLFGYTGAATLVCAAAGAKVTHVDASKPSIAWGRHNQALSGMDKAPIRWLLDDAFKFVAREIRRERQYDFILLDPPSFGRGPKGELWKVEHQLGPLLENIRKILNPARAAVVLTFYNLEASSLMLRSLFLDQFPGGNLEYGELVLPCTGSDKILPLSLFARWEGSPA